MKTVWKIIISIVVVIALIAGGFWLWLTYEGSTKDIEAVANQFQVPSSWVETANKAVGVRNVCLEANCPSVSKSWKVPYVISKVELTNMLQKADWNLPVDKECDIATGGNGTGTAICEARGSINGYSVVISVIGASNHPKSTTVTFDMR